MTELTVFNAARALTGMTNSVNELVNIYRNDKKEPAQCYR